MDGTITVPGWLMDDGSLWIRHVGEQVTIFSPMLFPHRSATLFIKGVTHRQSDGEGTVTDVMVSNLKGQADFIQVAP